VTPPVWLPCCIPGLEVDASTCSLCGALVGDHDRVTHEAWHESVVDIRRLVAALTDQSSIY
jgi:hypothetical protein